MERISTVRNDRDSKSASSVLAALEAACATDGNLFEPVLAAVEARCTIGEIVPVMEDRWGTFQASRA